MCDKKKIIIMTKLAVYDKNFSEEDMRNDRYFRHDYIYKKNMRNRIFVFIGCIIVILLNMLHRIIYGSLDIYALNYTVELTKIVLFFAVMLIAYTVIGTIIFTADFHKSQKRLEKYFKLLDKLDRYTAAKQKRMQALADAENADYGTEDYEAEYDETEDYETDEYEAEYEADEDYETEDDTEDDMQ